MPSATIKTSVFDNLTDIIIPKSVTKKEYAAFYSCDNLDVVYYGGTEEEWNAIPDGYGNDKLYYATVCYYTKTEPLTAGNYWHYVNGVPTVW